MKGIGVKVERMARSSEKSVALGQRAEAGGEEGGGTLKLVRPGERQE